VRLPRPHIPVPVRLEVAARQLVERGIPITLAADFTKRERLALMLWLLFKDEPRHLDHDPPLMLRQYDEASGRYTPDANHPDYLVYRSKTDHRVKTYVRGDGAQLSDAGKRRKEIRRRRKASRPKWRWPKGRKLRSRPWGSRGSDRRS
jgi:hypothetical protein